MSRWGPPLRRHALFLVALAGAAVLRWTALRAYPSGLWFTGDSYFYIGHALNPRPSPTRTTGYSMLLWLLRPAHSLYLVVFVQHVLGLAVAVMLYALLRRARLPGWAAVAASLPVLYDGYQVQLEHLVMSETLFTFLLVAGVTVLLWRPLGPDRARPGWKQAVAAGALISAATLVRSAGAPLVPLLPLGLLLWRGGWRSALAFGTAAAVPLLSYAFWFQQANGTFALTTSDGIFLWGRTANWASCAKIRPPADERDLCLPADVQAKRIPPGRLDWISTIPPRRRWRFVAAPEANRTLRDFALRAILAQPRAYATDVVRGIGYTFENRRRPYPNGTTEMLYHFRDRPQIFPGGRGWSGRGGTALGDILAYTDDGAPSRVNEPEARRMIAYQRNVHLPGPALAAVFALGAVAALRRGRAPLVALGTAVTLLVFPIATADFDYRYVMPVLPFACLAAALVFAPRNGDGPGGAGAVHRWIAHRARVSRWWGSPGSRRRATGPASGP
ncbi:phospholipid carrier-dependent glycosyltransferase [Actinomadura logoneensis]|uniref:Phospholipid carrier-dependent glycosyltransferase n=1 Tax=Actinomadura logoneensis TaxID=2293572 RepID=A0A372JK76_9ACTN|nr:phospholipid carrier-dependent glycosyltransferase [Actinomadura logoneensis]RFU40405.1 phospholipid carrier-dependent glycosyltransferase [Actinomadura logoneensis]